MITIIGLGFVGLTTGLGFAKKGFKTYGIDINKERSEQLSNFIIPFHEPHLKEILEETAGKTFFLNPPLAEAVNNSKLIFICVGTPSSDDGSADLTYLYSALDQIIQESDNSFKVITIKSTVPPSTLSEKVIPYISGKVPNHQNKFAFASNPEFLREGYCWEDFIAPDRIVIGLDNEEAKNIFEEVYGPFSAPIHFVSPNTAEFIKYLSNTLLSTLISYSNEMSIIADKIGDIEISRSFRILHEDKRWNGTPAPMSSYVYPGCGYGGYCLPKDTQALDAIARNRGFETQVLRGNLKINEDIKDYLVGKLMNELEKETSIGILGLSFKPLSDDVRITPTKDIIQKLLEAGFTRLSAFDPLANGSFRKQYPELELTYYNDLDSILDNVDSVVILTAAPEFKQNKEKIAKKRVFDFRYIY